MTCTPWTHHQRTERQTISYTLDRTLLCREIDPPDELEALPSDVQVLLPEFAPALVEAFPRARGHPTAPRNANQSASGFSARAGNPVPRCGLQSGRTAFQRAREDRPRRFADKVATKDGITHQKVQRNRPGTLPP